MNPLAIWRDAKQAMPLKLSGYVIDGIAPSTSLIDGTLTITFSRPQYAQRFMEGTWEDKPVSDVVAQYVSDAAGFPVTVTVNPFCLNGVRVENITPSKPGVPKNPKPRADEDAPSASASGASDSSEEEEGRGERSGVKGFFSKLFHRD